MSLRQLSQESLGMNGKVQTQTADDCFHRSSNTVLKTLTPILHHLEAFNYHSLISTLITFVSMCNITFLGSQHANGLKLLSRHLTPLKMKSVLFNRCSFCTCGFCLLTPFYYQKHAELGQFGLSSSITENVNHAAKEAGGSVLNLPSQRPP